jgi:hypothetical protein|tara:strand:+ start:146 stop:580 length:435 start_codon:yes stop_codon:yes gene_type:complete
MPKSKNSKKKIFREFSKLNQIYVKRNYLKNLRNVMASTKEKTGLKMSYVYFMLWAYDLEFFTMRYVSQDYGYQEEKVGDRLVYPLQRQGYIYKYFNRFDKNTYDYQMFKDRGMSRMQHRTRYCLTQKGRLFVQSIYREMEKDEA